MVRCSKGADCAAAMSKFGGSFWCGPCLHSRWLSSGYICCTFLHTPCIYCAVARAETDTGISARFHLLCHLPYRQMLPLPLCCFSNVLSLFNFIVVAAVSSKRRTAVLASNKLITVPSSSYYCQHPLCNLLLSCCYCSFLRAYHRCCSHSTAGSNSVAQVRRESVRDTQGHDHQHLQATANQRHQS